MDFTILFILAILLSIGIFVAKVVAVGWIAKKVINNTDFFDFNSPHQVKTKNLNELSAQLQVLENTIHQEANFDDVDDQFKKIYLLIQQHQQNAQQGVTQINQRSQHNFLDTLGKIMAASNRLEAANRLDSRRYNSNMNSIYSAAVEVGIDPRSL